MTDYKDLLPAEKRKLVKAVSHFLVTAQQAQKQAGGNEKLDFDEIERVLFRMENGLAFLAHHVPDFAERLQQFTMPTMVEMLTAIEDDDNGTRWIKDNGSKVEEIGRVMLEAMDRLPREKRQELKQIMGMASSIMESDRGRGPAMGGRS